jgi:hypothetical protein
MAASNRNVTTSRPKTYKSSKKYSLSLNECRNYNGNTMPPPHNWPNSKRKTSLSHTATNS